MIDQNEKETVKERFFYIPELGGDKKNATSLVLIFKLLPEDFFSAPNTGKRLAEFIVHDCAKFLTEQGDLKNIKIIAGGVTVVFLEKDDALKEVSRYRVENKIIFEAVKVTADIN